MGDGYRESAPRGRLTDVPAQRRSAYAMRHEAARRCRELAYESEVQDLGESPLSPLFSHLARLFAAPPQEVPNQDMGRLAAVLLNEPMPATPEPITDGIQIPEEHR